MMTVSRVLRGAPDVSDATRERVFAIVERVGYVPNQAAQSLVSHRSRIVAAIVPSIGNAMFAETLHGMSDVLRAEGYFLVVAHSGYSPREEHAVVKAVLGQRPCCGRRRSRGVTPAQGTLLRICTCASQRSGSQDGEVPDVKTHGPGQRLRRCLTLRCSSAPGRWGL